MATFADRLKQLRIDSGLTQPQLAKKLDMSNGAIGNYESGKRFPKYEDLEAIADLFNVNMDYLLGRSDIKPEYSLEQIYFMKCFCQITDENDKIAVKAILSKYADK